MARLFITGSSDGLGLMAARLLIKQGHEVVLRLDGRNDGRSRDALAAAPGAQGVVTGDLSTIAGARTVAAEVNKLGRFRRCNRQSGHRLSAAQRVETEPGVPSVFAVNVLAPYILTAFIERPDPADLSQLRNAPAACGRAWTICSGPSEPGAALRLMPRASCATSCSHLPWLAAGTTSNPTPSSLDGCRRKWVALQLPMIFSKGV